MTHSSTQKDKEIYGLKSKLCVQGCQRTIRKNHLCKTLGRGQHVTQDNGVSSKSLHPRMSIGRCKGILVDLVLYALRPTPCPFPLFRLTIKEPHT